MEKEYNMEKEFSLEFEEAANSFSVAALRPNMTSDELDGWLRAIHEAAEKTATHRVDAWPC